jgi:PD-(D/E)XK nuclease superfamily
MVVEIGADDHIHLSLVVANTGLELDRDPLENDPSLRRLRRDLGETTVAEERTQDRLLVLVGGTEGDPCVPGRAHLLRGPSQRLPIESVGAVIGLEAGDAGGREAGEMPAHPTKGQLERLGQRGGLGITRRQGARDAEPLRIGQGTKDVVRVLGHVGLVAYHDAMLLTDPQRRTLDRLIGTEERPVFAADLRQRLVDRIEGAARELELGEPLWLGKEALNQLARCEGRFAARLEREDPPFEHSVNTAAGVLVHKAIEVDVGARDGMDPHAIAATAAARLTEREERFAEFWREQSGSEQDELLMEVVRKVTLFQGSFPPLRELRREMAPITELPVKAQLLGGALTLSGKVDLVLGVPDRLEPNRATRLAVDLKTGGAWPEHAEDMRFYALLMTLRFGVPPYRVASLFLDSGEWQAEEVAEETLFHAADRVVSTARAAGALLGGREPLLTPGSWCAWCPRAFVCPSAEPRPV